MELSTVQGPVFKIETALCINIPYKSYCLHRNVVNVRKTNDQPHIFFKDDLPLRTPLNKVSLPYTALGSF